MKPGKFMIALLVMVTIMSLMASCAPAAPAPAQPAQATEAPKAEAPQATEAPKAETPKVTLNFMADSRSEFVTMEKLLPEFTKATGIDVKMTQLQETPLRAKTGLELSAPSTEMDVIMVDFQLMKKYAEAGVLEPLDSYLKNESTFKESDFQGPFLEALRNNGKLYGLPLYQDTNILIYRADVFKELGLKPPTTYDELKDVAQKITEAKKADGMYGIALRGQRGMGVNEWTWPTFLWGYGGSYYKNYPTDMHPNLDTPEAKAACEYYVDMIKNYAPPGAANYSYVEVQGDLMENKAAMIIDSATLGIRAQDPAQSKVAGKLGYTEVPKGPKGDQPGFYTWTIVSPAKSAHKAEAAKFMAWLLSPEIGPQIGWSAPNQSLEKVYNIPAYKDLPESKPLIDVMKAALGKADADYRPRAPEQTEVGTIVSEAISDSIAGNKTCDQAMKDANDAIDQVMKKAGYYQ